MAPAGCSRPTRPCYWPSWNFLRKHARMREDEFSVQKPFFDLAMLSHDHSEYGAGLKRIMKH